METYVSVKVRESDFVAVICFHLLVAESAFAY